MLFPHWEIQPPNRKSCAKLVQDEEAQLRDVISTSSLHSIVNDQSLYMMVEYGMLTDAAESTLQHCDLEMRCRFEYLLPAWKIIISDGGGFSFCEISPTS